MTRLCTLSLMLFTLSAAASAQMTSPQGDAANPAHSSAPIAIDAPLPDISTLMHQVEAHQRLAEAIEKDYIFREDSVFNERNPQGGIKKTEGRGFEIFWINGVRIARLVRKDGKDLSPEDLRKENDRIDKEVAKAKERRAKADEDGKETDSHGHDEITVSRILELGTFSNPRRQLVNGRPTILVDYNGNPDAKTHNPGEAALKLLQGTVWVDEQDRTIEHAEGHFIDNFKIGGGLLASVHKDTSFKWTTVRINDEVWLPSTVDAQGQARYLLFFSLNGDAHIHASDYRKFKATSTILPNVTPVAQPPDSHTPATQPPAFPPTGPVTPHPTQTSPPPMQPGA